MKSREQIRKKIKQIMDTTAFNYAVTIFGLVIVVVFYTLSQPGAEASGSGQSQEATSETELDFAVVAEGIEAYKYPDQEGKVISDQEKWEPLWDKLQIFTIPQPALPEIDFSKQIILGVFAGKKDGGGYMVHVEKVIIKPGQEIVIYVVEKRVRPSDQASNNSQSAHPFQIITIPRVDLPVRFEFL